MSEFTVRKTRHGKWGVYMPNGGLLDSFISEQKAINRANYLNEGIAVTDPTLEQKINDFAKISVELQSEAMKPLQEEIARLEAFYNAMKPLVINLDTGKVKNIYFGYEDGKVYITPIDVQGIIAAYKKAKEEGAE